MTSNERRQAEAIDIDERPYREREEAAERYEARTHIRPHALTWLELAEIYLSTDIFSEELDFE